MKPGEVTTVKPGVIKVASNLPAFYFVVRDLEGKEAIKDNPSSTKVALPPGKYAVEIDTEKWIKTLSDEQRKVEIELGEGEEIELKIE